MTLETLPADRSLVDDLYTQGHLSAEGRTYALSLLYPHTRWGWWTANLLLAVGAVLVLTGVVFFFAYNWNQIPPMAKLGVIEGALAVCLIGAIALSMRHLVGQTLLMAASVFVGVFLAVFGQIYQTGADAWQLFAVWLMLITPWTLLSCFAGQWVLWLALANTSLILWWGQAVSVPRNDELLIFGLLMALNGGALLAIEWGSSKQFPWLKPAWTSPLVLTGLLLCAFIPAFVWIMEDFSYGSWVFSAVALIGLAVHGVAFAFYRYAQPRLWAIALIILSLCVLIETVIFQRVMDFSEYEAGLYLLIAMSALAIFGGGVAYLRHMQKALRGKQ